MSLLSRCCCSQVLLPSTITPAGPRRFLQSYSPLSMQRPQLLISSSLLTPATTLQRLNESIRLMQVHNDQTSAQFEVRFPPAATHSLLPNAVSHSTTPATTSLPLFLPASTSYTILAEVSRSDPRARRLASAARLAKNNNNKGPPLYSKAARRFYNEKFRAEPERLSKVLAAAGVASRRGCEEVIFEGRVSVNGDVCKVPQTPVDLLKDIIYVDGRSLPKKLAPKLYFALNKPKGYVATVNDRVTRRHLQTIANGTMVQGVQCVPQEVELLDVESSEEHPRVRIVVSEGRNHEVRHLVENSGLQVLALKRTRVGGLRLSRKLGIGKFDSLSTSQIADVLNKTV